MFIRFVVGRDGEDHRWLNDHLPCPPFRRSRWPKQAVCWFKDDAGGCIGRMWDLVFLLQQHGRAVRVLKSRRPGRILYEDAYQVVVDEWRNL